VRALNELAHDGEAGGGMVLVVPRVDDATRAKNRDKAIAALHASGPDQKPGEPLIVAVTDKAATVAGKRRVFYRVVAGDKLAELARALGVAAADLVAWNELVEDAELQPRMVLQAWVEPKFDAARANVRLLDDARLLVVTRGSVEHLDVSEARLGRVRVEYTAKKEESFEAIGKKFGLGPRDLARINKMKSTSVIEPGQTIIVYKVADKTRSDRAAAQWKKTPEAQRKPAPAAQRKPAPVRTADRVAGPVASPSELEADTGGAAADRDGDAGHP
jgi:membrane-bound lytic murein transglycosylase D